MATSDSGVKSWAIPVKFLLLDEGGTQILAYSTSFMRWASTGPGFLTLTGLCYLFSF
jgi:hypothetical protein